MRKGILVVAVLTGLAVAGTAVAIAAQRSPSDATSDRSLDAGRGICRPMGGEWEEMPMLGGSAGEGDEDWSRWHEGMGGWMSDHREEMPMFGGSGTAGWGDASGMEGGFWCRGIVSGV